MPECSDYHLFGLFRTTDCRSGCSGLVVVATTPPQLRRSVVSAVCGCAPCFLGCEGFGLRYLFDRRLIENSAEIAEKLQEGPEHALAEKVCRSWLKSDPLTAAVLENGQGIVSGSALHFWDQEELLTLWGNDKESLGHHRVIPFCVGRYRAICRLKWRMAWLRLWRLSLL